ncbi:beta family protein [Sessilibacter corallicola]|uniref:Beta family protein n=1 Tax=Sessilibacter corallicola TaxID=2904075 RepID=A0ABQ0A566_9GAMM
MEVKYVPFLKSKANEIHALAGLDESIAENLVPFFDYPKKQSGDKAEDIGPAIIRLAKKFKKHLGGFEEFYFDVYDLSDGLEIEGDHLYSFLLGAFSDLPLVPVVSIDRSDDHLNSVIKGKEKGVVSSNYVAFRVTPEDFQNFDAVIDDIEDMLNPIFSLFEMVDLIFDCRICSNLDSQKLSKQIDVFTKGFVSSYPVRRVVVSGSSIPASVAEVLSSNSEKYVERVEVDIFSAAVSLGAAQYVFGDYTTISPDYSDADIPGDQMQGRITAKFIYSFEGQHYFIRGGSLKTKGRDQYYDLAEVLCSKDFFRGPEYSTGDAYFYEKSCREGDKCWVTTVIKPSIDAHISYTVKDFLADCLL